MQKLLTRKSALLRPPSAWDWAGFFLVLPMLFSVWLATTGISLAAGMTFWAGCAYMAIHFYASWWATAAGSEIFSQLLSRWRYPVWLVLCLGWLVTLAPLAWFYTWLPEFFARYYPQLEPTVRGAEFSWSLSYLGQFLRGSLPWLLIWVCLVYGYRFVFGVDWFGSSSREFDEPVRTEAWPAKDHGGEPPVPEILRRSHLPLDVRIVALKAEEHYVRVWTNDGTELLRYRFRDAMKEMTEQPGLQVHRSWWVRLDGIDEVRNKGRGLELELSNGITVPVSLAHRSEFLQAFEKSPRRQRMVSDTISSPTSSGQPLSP